MNNKANFIRKANGIHNNRYDYSNVEYINNKNKVIIICPKHGEFTTTPERHLIGVGCPICSGYKLNTAEFIRKANGIHNNRYDYSNVEYINNKNKVIIICPKHGEFKQLTSMHLMGQGCPKCANESNAKNRRMTQNEFILNAKLKHNNKFDYCLVQYIHSQIKVKIICPKHGIFKQKPNQHLLGHNCPKCAIINAKISKRKTTEEFIIKANNVHNNKYDYSKVNYVGSINKIMIICPKHGKFEQQPANHLMGQGCPICYESKGEKKIRNILEEFNVRYVSQKTFNNCKGISRKLPYDFYIPNINMVIEYNGQQHYEPIKYFGGMKTFNRIIKNDVIKRNFLKKNNIKLIEIKFIDFNNIKTILINEGII